MMGTVNIPVPILGNKFQDVKFYVNDSKANIVILGRGFMGKYESVTLNSIITWCMTKIVDVKNSSNLKKIKRHPLETNGS